MTRFLRTVASLTPGQVAWRLPHRALSPVAQALSGAAGPVLAPPPIPAGCRALARSEAERVATRSPRLSQDPGLQTYESAAGFSLGDLPPAEVPDSWNRAEGSDPWPAAVRARRLAICAALGGRAPWMQSELARAARAVLLRPEFHLRGNHLMEDALGLVCAGSVTAGREADVWRGVGLWLLRRTLAQQFLRDGGHEERSATYQAALVAGGLEALALLGPRAPEWMRDALERALGWLVAVRAPDGTLPLFNDAALDAAPDLDLVLQLARELGLRVSASRLGDTGWRVLRSPDGCAWLVADAGPDGAPTQPGHAHADALAFELWVDSRRVVVDTGVEAYAIGPARDRTRATRSHGTVELLGQDSAEVWAAFRVGRRQRAWIEEEGATRLVAAHDGYRHLPGAPVHRRTWRLDDGALRVDDEVAPATSGTTRLILDAEASAAVRVDAPGAVARKGSWFPRHGAGQPAVVWEAPFDGTGGWTLSWR